MNFLETTGYVLCMAGLIAVIGALIFRARPLALVAAVDLLIGAGFLFYSL